MQPNFGYRPVNESLEFLQCMAQQYACRSVHPDVTGLDCGTGRPCNIKQSPLLIGKMIQALMQGFRLRIDCSLAGPAVGSDCIGNGLVKTTIECMKFVCSDGLLLLNRHSGNRLAYVPITMDNLIYGVSGVQHSGAVQSRRTTDDRRCRRRVFPGDHTKLCLFLNSKNIDELLQKQRHPVIRIHISFR